MRYSHPGADRGLPVALYIKSNTLIFAFLTGAADQKAPIATTFFEPRRYYTQYTLKIRDCHGANQKPHFSTARGGVFVWGVNM